jgi:hypothetical protein
VKGHSNSKHLNPNLQAHDFLGGLKSPTKAMCSGNSLRTSQRSCLWERGWWCWKRQFGSTQTELFLQ